jgi:hypothetical protein
MAKKHPIRLLPICPLGIILYLLVLFHFVNIPYLLGQFSACALNVVIFKSASFVKVVGLERGPLSLMSTTEELLDRKVVATV